MRRCERIPELELQLEQTRTNVDSGVPASASWHCLEELLTSYGVGGHRTCVIISGEWKAAAAESRASAAVSSQGDVPRHRRRACQNTCVIISGAWRAAAAESRASAAVSRDGQHRGEQRDDD